MTSKLSFYNKLKEEFSHHIVSMFLIVLYSVVRLLFYYFEIQGIASGTLEKHDLQYLVNATAAPSFGKMLPVIFLAAFLATEFFSYLHSRKKCDFYLSLPGGRTERFVMGMVMSGIMFLVPCLLERCAETIIAFSSGYATLNFTENLLWEIVCTFLAFTASWVTMAFAMVVTGNLAIGILGYGMICAYVPVILKELIPLFEQFFFVTYVRSAASDWWYYFSPMSLVLGLTRDFDNSGFENQFHFMIATVIWVGVVGGLALLLHKKRPGEAAGRAMAFKNFNTAIKFMIVIPLGLYCGYFISEFSVTDQKMWLVVGTIVGVMLLHGMMESIYEFGIHGMLEKKRQMIASVLLGLGFVAFFWADVIEFNKYIPEEKDVESVELNINSNNMNYYDKEPFNKDRKGISGKYIHMILTLAENMVSQVSSDVETDSDLYKIIVRYQLKNGTKKSRCYKINLDKEGNRALLNLICATEEFKDDYYELYEMASEDIREIRVGNSFVTEKVLLSKEEQEQFIDIYKMELTELTFSQMEEMDKWAELTFTYKNHNEETCYIYSSFKRTIDFLGQHGYKIISPFKEYEVVSLEVYDDVGKKTLVVSDVELLEGIKEEIVLEQMYCGYVFGIPDARYATVGLKVNGTLQNQTVLLRPQTIDKLENGI